MIRHDKIIFVCTDNTCRSPMAEAIYNSLVTESDIKICSRGFVVLFPEPYNPKVEMVLKSHGLSLETHTAVPLIAKEIDKSALILTMSLVEKIKIIEKHGFGDNIYTIKEFLGEEGDVMDPYGGTIVEYEACFIELSQLLQKVVVKLQKGEENQDDRNCM